jgi:hypothetical protein
MPDPRVSKLAQVMVDYCLRLKPGQGLPECGSKNESGLHWATLCAMTESEIRLDGDLFYKNGKFDPS